MKMRGFTAGVMVSLSVLVGVFLSSDSHAIPTTSLWPQNGNYLVTQAQSPGYNTQNLCTYQTIKVKYSLNLPPSERDACVYETEYGSYASSGHIKRFVGDYVQLIPLVVPVPNTDKMYAKVCGYPCKLVYYDVKQGFNPSGGSYGYQLNPKAPATPVKDPSGASTLAVFSIGFSPNGRWLGIETYGGFIRYDTETEEVLWFSLPRGSYGVGQNPSFQYSITDDGRYVVLSGNNYRSATVFDLHRCEPTKDVAYLGTRMSCPTVELTDVARKKGFSVSELYGATFQAGGREITAYSTTGTSKPQGYVFRLDSLEARADYVALGDSFSSGEGDLRDNTRYLLGTDGTAEFPNEKCHISGGSYPFLLRGQNASKLSFAKTFACSGAETRHIKEAADQFVGQFQQIKGVNDLTAMSAFHSFAYNSDVAGRIPQYKFIEKYQPKAMTITIGGNDAGFGNVLKACITSGSCEFESLERGAKGLEMYNTFGRLRETYRKLLVSSPSSKLYVLSYPQFIDDANQCNPNVGLNAEERRFVRESVSYFNQVIRQAALAEGATFIDIEKSLEGEALCSSKLVNLAVNGIVDGDDVYGVIGQESFHPNAYGHELIASYIKNTYGLLPELEGEVCPVTDCSGYRAPAIPGYFGTLSSTVQRYKFALIDQVKGYVEQASQLKISMKSSISNAVGRLFLHSKPRDLGVVIANGTGEFNATINIPADAEPGYHEIHLQTTAPDGTKISYYQPVTIIASEDDVDGDGILNGNDACSFVEAADVDKDKDGIDDACDGDVGQAPVALEPLPDIVGLPKIEGPKQPMTKPDFDPSQPIVFQPANPVLSSSPSPISYQASTSAVVSATSDAQRPVAVVATDDAPSVETLGAVAGATDSNDLNSPVRSAAASQAVSEEPISRATNPWLWWVVGFCVVSAVALAGIKSKYDPR